MTGVSDAGSGFEGFARFVSPGRAEMFRSIGFEATQGRREGVYLYDDEGNRYINCRSSGGVFNLGHRPPSTVEALISALGEVDIGDWLLPSRHRAEAARKISDSLPGGDWISFFVPGGGEAVDVALKLARLNTGRTGVLSVTGGYHGHTGLAISAGHEHYTEGLGELVPGFARVPMADAAAIEDAMDDSIGAVILETIPATAGMVMPPDDYLSRVRAACDRTGALLVLDEVQSGLGRTGRVWAFEHWDARPDIVIVGKGLSGGVYPISACVYRSELDEPLRSRPSFHPSSFGGAELGAIVASAVMDEVTAPAFLQHVRERGAEFADGFAELQEAHGIIGEFRRRGVMMGYDLPSPEHALLMTQRLIEQGVISIFADNRPQAMQLMPPLIISEDEVRMVLEALDKACAAVEAEVSVS